MELPFRTADPPLSQAHNLQPKPSPQREKLTTNPPTLQLTNPPAHQPTNPATHQPTNPPTPPTLLPRCEAMTSEDLDSIRLESGASESGQLRLAANLREAHLKQFAEAMGVVPFSRGVPIGVLFGCFGRKIDGTGLPGGLIIYQGHLFPPKGHLWGCPFWGGSKRLTGNQREHAILGGPLKKGTIRMGNGEGL